MSRYELIDRIGLGGMAEVFRGRALGEGGFEKPVAIKRILPHLSQDMRFVKLLVGEAKTLAKLKQRNIVQIFDVGVDSDGQYFLVMEYIDGSDLGAIVETMSQQYKRFPVELSLYLGSEVSAALDHAHRSDIGAEGSGIIHRDVTPANILLSRSGEVKLTDFGIAKLIESDRSKSGEIKGKLAYMSPEQASGKNIDIRSDVFSLGVVLFELVTGQPLFSAPTETETLQLVQRAEVPDPRELDSSVSPELSSVLLRALSRDPAARYADAQAFGDALREHRYSMLTSVGDPSREVGLLVSKYTKGEVKQSRPSKVLRIHTVDGFPLADPESMAPEKDFENAPMRRLTAKTISEARARSDSNLPETSGRGDPTIKDVMPAGLMAGATQAPPMHQETVPQEAPHNEPVPDLRPSGLVKSYFWPALLLVIAVLGIATYLRLPK